MIDEKLQERVINKRNEFLHKVKGLGLSEDVIEEISVLLESMEYANQSNETDIAKEYKYQVKKIIKENL